MFTTSFLLLAIANADIIDDVTYAFASSPEFISKRTTFDDDTNAAWGSSTSPCIFDQVNSGLCSIYAATAVTRQPVSPRTAGRAICNVDWCDWESPSEIVSEGIPGLRAFDETGILEEHVLEQTYFAAQYKDAKGEMLEQYKDTKGEMREDFARLIAERLIDYPNQKRGFTQEKVFKGFLVASNTGGGHTIGLTYKNDDGYRVFDSNPDNSDKFEKDSLRINVDGKTEDDVAAEVSTIWDFERNHFYGTINLVAVFGPLNESPCSTPRSASQRIDILDRSRQFFTIRLGLKAAAAATEIVPEVHDEELTTKLNNVNWQDVLADYENAVMMGADIGEATREHTELAKKCIAQYRNMSKAGTLSEPLLMNQALLDEAMEECASAAAYEKAFCTALGKQLQQLA